MWHACLMVATVIYHKKVSADQTGGQPGGARRCSVNRWRSSSPIPITRCAASFATALVRPPTSQPGCAITPLVPGPDLSVGATEVTTFRALRVAIRSLCQACVDALPGDDQHVEVLNAAAATAPRWPQLHYTGGAYAVSEHTRQVGADAALAAIARDAIAILGGPLRTDIRACQGPGCVLFFVKDHPRRQWCSAGCGNRARAARHYQRHRTPAPLDSAPTVRGSTTPCLRLAESP